MDWGSFRRLEPLSRVFGQDRGTPVDRYYIEGFLAANSGGIRGRTLEIGDRAYTKRFGGDRVSRSDVLHAAAGNPEATIVGELSSAVLPEEAFDCIILTQTLLCVYDVAGAVAGCRRALKKGGVVLATVPGISQISRYDMDRWGDFWRFTTLSAQRLFSDAFGAANVQAASYGNVLAATAFLQGLAWEELKKEELDFNDPDYQLVVTVRAVK